MSLRDSILSIDDRPREEVDLPEWGCKLFARMMTVDEYNAWIRCAINTPYDIEAKVVQGIEDEIGNKVFQAGKWKEEGDKKTFEAADEALLAKKGYSALAKLGKAVDRMNRLAEAKDAK